MLALASLLATTAVNAAEETVDSLFLGNSQGNGVSMAGSQVTGGALYFPESYMKLCEGNYIESVWLYVNAPASYVSSLEVFVSHSLDAPYDFSMSGAVEHFGWNEIVFDEPYQLDGSALYIGFEMAGASVSYANRIMEGDEFSYSDGEWQPYTGNYSHAFYGVVRGDNLPRHNVSVDWTTPFGYATTGRLCDDGRASDHRVLGAKPWRGHGAEPDIRLPMGRWERRADRRGAVNPLSGQCESGA